jgi:hypothetical protein
VLDSRDRDGGEQGHQEAFRFADTNHHADGRRRPWSHVGMRSRVVRMRPRSPGCAN